MVEKGGLFVLILYLKALQTEADTISDPWVVGPARGWWYRASRRQQLESCWVRANTTPRKISYYQHAPLPTLNVCACIQYVYVLFTPSTPGSWMSHFDWYNSRNPEWHWTEWKSKKWTVWTFSGLFINDITIFGGYLVCITRNKTHIFCRDFIILSRIVTWLSLFFLLVKPTYFRWRFFNIWLKMNIFISKKK